MELISGRTPQALADAPKLYGLGREIVYAFNKLAQRRTCGMSANPIPLSEIHAYIQLFGEPSCSIDLFEEMIGLMDKAEMELASGNATSNR